MKARKEATQWSWLRGATRWGCAILTFVLSLFARWDSLDAAVLLYDPFDYPDGPLAPQSKGLWTTHSGSDDDISVLDSALVLNKLRTADVSAALGDRSIPSTLETVLYVAAVMAEAALAEPLNGTVDLAGPEPIRQDDLVRQFLSATGDARTVVTDPKALYYGIAVNDQSLTPGDNPRLGPTRFADWLSRTAA